MSIYVKQSFGLQSLSDGGQWEYDEAKLGTDIAEGEIKIYTNEVSKLIALTGWFQPNILGISATIIIATELPKIYSHVRFTAIPYSGIKNTISLIYDSASSMLYTDSNMSQNVLKEKYFIHSAIGILMST